MQASQAGSSRQDPRPSVHLLETCSFRVSPGKLVTAMQDGRLVWRETRHVHAMVNTETGTAEVWSRLFTVHPDAAVQPPLDGQSGIVKGVEYLDGGDPKVVWLQVGAGRRMRLLWTKNG